jgi:hypothetical protein
LLIDFHHLQHDHFEERIEGWFVLPEVCWRALGAGDEYLYHNLFGSGGGGAHFVDGLEKLVELVLAGLEEFEIKGEHLFKVL